MDAQTAPMLPGHRFNLSIFYYSAVYKNSTFGLEGACSILLTGWTTNEKSGYGIPKNSGSNFVHCRCAVTARYHAEIQGMSADEAYTDIMDRDNLQARVGRALREPVPAARRINYVLTHYDLVTPEEQKSLGEKFDLLLTLLHRGDTDSAPRYAIAYLAAAFKLAIHYSGKEYIATQKGKLKDPSAGDRIIERFETEDYEAFGDQLAEVTLIRPGQENLSEFPPVSRALLWDKGAEQWQNTAFPSAIMFASSGEPAERFDIFLSREGEDASIPLLRVLTEPEQKHCFLLGRGGAGKTTALHRLMEESYREKVAPTEGPIPLYLDLSTAPDVSGPLYRDGHSTFIRRSLYRLLFGEKQLSPATHDRDRLAPTFTVGEDVILPRIEELLKQENASPALLLLLDGVNEMSRTVPEEGMPPVAVMVQQEIDLLVKHRPNVRIILTSRTDDRIIAGENVIHYTLCGLDDAIIRQCIADRISPRRADAVMADPLLLKVLRLPLFLSIYIRLKDTHTASTQGELLHIFFGECRADDLYTTRKRNRQIEQNLKQAVPGPQIRLTAEMQAFIIDFILPEIAWRMGDRLWMYRGSIVDAVRDIFAQKSETSVRGNAGIDAFPQYRDPYNLEKHTDYTAQTMEKLGLRGTGELNEQSLTDKILTYCLFTLGILQRDHSNYGFTHQIFQDYFAALKVINTFRIAAEAWRSAETERGETRRQKQQAAFACLSDVLGDAPLDPSIRRMIGEILGEHRRAPQFRDGRWLCPAPADEPRSLCEQMLDICRGQDEGGVGYTVFNLVQILKESRGRDLSGLDFSGLDLRRCSLNGTRLSRPGLTSTFAGAKLTRDTLFPTGHTSFINSIAYHPDPSAHMLITASCDHTAKLWDTRTGVCIGTLRGHEGTVTSAAFNPRDPRYALTASYDGTAKIWDCRTLECVQTIQTHQDGVVFSGAAFHASGTVIAAISDRRTVTLWEPDTQGKYTCTDTLNDFSDDLNRVKFAPEGERLLTLHGEKFHLRVWRKTATGWSYTETDAERLGLNGIKDAVFHPDGNRILVSPMLSSVMVELNADTLEPLPENAPPEVPFSHAVYTPDGQKIVSVGNDLAVFDARNYRELLRIPDLRRDTLLFCPCAVSPDGNFVAFDNGAAVEIREIKTGAVRTLLSGFWRTVNSAAYHPSGRHIITSGEDGAAAIWSAHAHGDGCLPPYRCTALLLQEDSIKLAEFHPAPDSKQLLTVGKKGEVHLWDIPSETHTAAYTDDLIYHAAYNLTGTSVLLSSLTGIGFALWDPQTGELAQSTYRSTFAAEGKIPLRDHNGNEKTVTRYLSISGDQDDLCLWQAHVSFPDRHHSLEKQELPKGLPFPVYNRYNTAAFSHNGRMVLAGQHGGRLTLYDSLLKELLSAAEMGESASHLCFSPDDTRAAVASWRSIRLWDIREEKLTPVETPSYECPSFINSVTYSPDGQHILAALGDGTCRILDAETLTCLHTIPHIVGLFVRGTDFTRTEEIVGLTEEDRQNLRLYGARIN